MSEPSAGPSRASGASRDALERQLAEARTDARQLAAQNAKLQELLRQARDRIAGLRQQVDALAQPPLRFATVVGPVVEGAVDVVQGAARMRVAIDPTVQPASLAPGARVLLNEATVLVAAAGRADGGEIAVVRERSGADHAIVTTPSGGEAVVRLAAALLRDGIKLGDSVVVVPHSDLAVARVPRAEADRLVLEEVPDLDYEQIGGLAEQIDQVRDAVELPFLQRERYAAYGLRAPKGILLYGPPGCGKTMIAKAVAHSLSTALSAQSGGRARSYFLSVKGPELLNKYVGESERQIRAIFQQARERASAGMPVIVFFDEMDALFRTRGSGVSSDVETTIVPQLLSEIDGVEGLDNVIIMGASNREDMIDPALLRPGRLDVKIKLERPTAAGARDIVAKYLTPQLPLRDALVAQHGGDRAAAVAAMIDDLVERLYAPSARNAVVEVTLASGRAETLYARDFVSGAMLANVVARAKKYAIKAELAGEPSGITTEHLLAGLDDELAQNQDLPNTASPDEWARLNGYKGERVTALRAIAR